MSKTSERIRIAMANRGLKQSQVALQSGIDRGSISSYISGRYEPKQDKLFALAKVLRVSPEWLAGQDVPMRGIPTETNYEAYGLRPITTKKFPMLGEIACGKPIYASEEHATYIDASASIDADFCLTAKGDSMINARIKDGDVVFIKQMPIVQNGEIAAVVIDDEATLKYWHYYPDKQKLVLNPANPAYEPLVYTGSELDTIICLGKAVCYMSNL